ncbi:S41 family peptidase [Cytophagales bacterium LB-30]|uniref:S41 family peptidase n=1 Tax=Shiella aurantiaca TaxID=3058365 RepID=A0ABT8F7D9_9BACT|nr:S41 family peptidase [Shiella aurantiaca]MDN4166203.1 S41 family peptidase [Shiella aurantiaca]
MGEIKNSKLQTRLPLFISLGVAAGILIGATLAEPGSGRESVSKGVAKIREVLGYVDASYVDEVDSEKLVEAAITEMLKELDPHTVYIPAEKQEMAAAELQGSFEGIGIEFDIFKDTLYVVSPLSGGPSEKAGIQTGDKIILVNGEEISGESLDYSAVHKYLRGPKGSEVKISIKRKNEKNLLEFTLIRDKIPQHSVDVHYMLDQEVGYIKVSRFSATTYAEFKSSLDDLISKGMKKLILDLQGNPGGYMNEAIKMADELLSGNKMIVYTKGRQTRYNSEARAERTGVFESGPVIVLIDEGSASASEIVSGALQDNDRALIVGRRSFGKGLVQMPVSLSDGSELRLTISRYYTPSGRSIQKPISAEYDSDYATRYEHGEFFHADSIKFADSLKFETTSGRIVYAGGGIMPDHFIALDTANSTNYLNQLVRSNILREYTVTYYEKNQKRIDKMGMDDFIANFEVTEAMHNEIVQLATKEGITLNKKELVQSLPLLNIYTKAFIARTAWSNAGFYPIFNQTNEALQAAIGLFDEAENLAKAN